MNRIIKALNKLLLLIVCVCLAGLPYHKVNADGAAGTITITVEKFTIGQGYLIEPVQVPIYNGDTAAMVLDRLLTDYGYSYDHDGTLTSSYYMRGIYNADSGNTSIPNVIKNMEMFISGGEVYKPPTDETVNENAPDLFEFDYGRMSGWMYTLNGVFADGLSIVFPQDGDVMRVQYSVYGYGADLGEQYPGSITALEIANKDALTKYIAEINADKSTYFSIPGFQSKYSNAMSVLQQHDVKQWKVTSALEELQEAANQSGQGQGNPDNPQPPQPPQPPYGGDTDNQVIQSIETSITESLSDLVDSSDSSIVFTIENSKAIEEIQAELDKLTDQQLSKISNLEEFRQAVEAYMVIVNGVIQDTDEAITKVAEASDQGSVVTKENSKSIEEINANLASLTDRQKENLKNSAAFEELQTAYQEAVVQKKAAVSEAIQSLGESDNQNLTLEEKEKVKEALAVLDCLTEDQQKDIANIASLDPFISAVESEKPIEEAYNAFAGIPAEITDLSQKEAVAAVRAAYENLTEAHKIRFSKLYPSALGALEAAEEAIYKLENKVEPGDRITKGSLIYEISSVGEKKTAMLYGSVKTSITTVSIPSVIKVEGDDYQVTAIRPGALKGRKKLKKLVIGANVATIGSKAFYGCKKLKSITIKTGKLSKIGSKAFAGIYKKAVIKVPAKKKKLYKKLLKGKGLKKTAKIK